MGVQKKRLENVGLLSNYYRLFFNQAIFIPSVDGRLCCATALDDVFHLGTSDIMRKGFLSQLYIELL